MKKNKNSKSPKSTFDHLATYDLEIGIDTGINTGVAVFDLKKRRLVHLETVEIYPAMLQVLGYKNKGYRILVKIEDARKRYIGETKKQAFERAVKGDKRTTAEITKAKAQGAGSVKRDASVWESFLKTEQIDYQLISPKFNITKSVPLFKQITGIDAVGLLGKVKAEHAVDAAFLVIR